MSKAEITETLISGAESGTLITAKHDPVGASIAWPGYRTVIDPVASSSFINEIKAGLFTASAYTNRYPNPFYVIQLTGSLNPVGLGFESGSTTPTDQCDRLVLVSGSVQPPHLFAEAQREIDDQVSSGSATFLGVIS